MNILSIIIVVVYAYILLNHVKETDYVSMLGLTFLTAILLCNQKNMKEGFDEISGKSQWKEDTTPEQIKEAELLSGSDQKLPTQDDKFKRKDDPVLKTFELIKHRMGPYDGLCLSSIEDENENSLISNDNLNSYLGVQGPLQSKQTDNNALNGPPVDGDPSSPSRLFMLSNNKASVNCCDDSPFSTSNGCVCVTDKQTKYLNSRGSNKSSPSMV